jgi:hypothetical protein
MATAIDQSHLFRIESLLAGVCCRSVVRVDAASVGVPG